MIITTLLKIVILLSLTITLMASLSSSSSFRRLFLHRTYPSSSTIISSLSTGANTCNSNGVASSNRYWETTFSKTRKQQLLAFTTASHCRYYRKTTTLPITTTSSVGVAVRGKVSLSSSPSYVKLSDPAPGSPFHLALPVHDLDIAKDFYGNVLGCSEGRSSEKWQDYSLHGHQIVCHWVGNDYRCQDYFNPVDGDEVPVPHFGLALTEEEFHNLSKRLNDEGIEFVIKPHLRFQNTPGEQWTMFFKDPSGNNLEFKAMTQIDNLFTKYNVVD